MSLGLLTGAFIAVTTVATWSGMPGCSDTTVGAPMPFQCVEAEAKENFTTGRVVRAVQPPRTGTDSPALEASGWAYVVLDRTGQYLQFRAASAANGLVLRHSIPDAAQGGGINATLSLYVNGEFRQRLALSSHYNWLYGKPGKNGQSNNPDSGQAHLYWDETRYFIKGGLRAGDTVRLVKTQFDTAAYYRIDLVELWHVAARLPPKEGTYLSVTAFGATPNDLTDDDAAIQKCLAAAKSEHKSVWIPAGTYYQARRIMIPDSVVVQGAGMWYTKLIGHVRAVHWGGNVGFSLGTGSALRNLSIESESWTQRSRNGGIGVVARNGSVAHWAVDRVWIEHTTVGLWMSGASFGVVGNSQIRSTYADGINLGRASHDNVVEDNLVRGTGDDGIAILSERKAPGGESMRDTVRRNTVVAPWWGADLDIGGGRQQVVEENYLADCAGSSVVVVNLPYAYPMYPLTGAILRQNVIVRGGGNFFGQRRGAIWVHPGDGAIQGLLIEGNQIIDPSFDALTIVGPNAANVVFRDNIVQNAGQRVVYIAAGAKGTALVAANRVTWRKGRHALVANTAVRQFKVVTGSQVP